MANGSRVAQPLGSGHVPEIFNTDQGCQFTSAEWTGRLIELDVRIIVNKTYGFLAS